MKTGEALTHHAETSSLLRWGGPMSEFVPAEAPAEVHVMDSWLVDDGRVRALSAHAARFRTSCMATVPGLVGQIEPFFAAVVERLPRRGRWFPRVELAMCDGMPQFRLWLRPAPPRGGTMVLWIAPEPDRRTSPTIKGPDWAYLAGLRQAAASHGADEALLLSPSGRLLEGSSSSLMWWRGNVLCAPPADCLLPGITQATLFDLARTDGVATSRSASPCPADLAGCEVWAVNALHGIRLVSGWIGGASVRGPAATRAELWNARLDGLAEPLPAC